MKRVLLAVALICFAGTAAQPGVKIEIIGGTLPDVPAKTRARMDLTTGEAVLLHYGKTELRIDYAKVNTIKYCQNVSRRYAAGILISPVLLLSKSRRHFVTLGYLDGESKQQALVVRIEKGDIRAVLASLEARTGRRVEYQDKEARK